ncbi:MAG: hypothetical protein Q8T11_04195 [Elusimicrobiota bacterium]|nr:hypothetical protein [Elusimicrobiota bacterium]
MRKILFYSLISLGPWSSARAASQETLTVRAIEWNLAWNSAPDTEWNARVIGAVSAAAKARADVIIFPEQFSGGRSLDNILDGVRAAAGEDRFVVLGNAPRRAMGEDHVVSRAYALSGGAWQAVDKLDPTPAELTAKPPVKAGARLPLFRFRGGVVAVLPSYSLQKTEIAASLKKRAVQLVLVPVPAEDERGAARLSRAAAARAVELGAAVVTAPPSPAAPSSYLPAQKGFDLAPQAPAGRDFRIPWKKILDLRASPEGSTEPRPFLEASYYQVEI